MHKKNKVQIIRNHFYFLLFCNYCNNYFYLICNLYIYFCIYPFYLLNKLHDSLLLYVLWNPNYIFYFYTSLNLFLNYVFYVNKLLVTISFYVDYYYDTFFLFKNIYYKFYNLFWIEELVSISFLYIYYDSSFCFLINSFYFFICSNFNWNYVIITSVSFLPTFGILFIYASDARYPFAVCISFYNGGKWPPYIF